MDRTNLIVLRKTQYRETSLIIAGITPDSGRIDILVKGAKKISAKNFPAVDLFREVNVEVNLQKHNLHSVYSADLIANHDNIASFHQNYLAACDIANFVLRNSQPDVPTPKLYTSVKHIFNSLAEKKTTVPYPALIKLVYMDEQGLLPETPDNDPEKAKLLSRLIEAAMGKNTVPEIDLDYWEKLTFWIDSLCRFHELH